VLQPAIPLRTSTPRTLKKGVTIRLVFVGNNFSGKAGSSLYAWRRRPWPKGFVCTSTLSPPR
jgi:hypothetical protein